MCSSDLITNTVTGGEIVGDTYFSLNMNNPEDIQSESSNFWSTIANVMDTVVLCATPILGSNNVKATGSMTAKWLNA